MSPNPTQAALTSAHSVTCADNIHFVTADPVSLFTFHAEAKQTTVTLIVSIVFPFVGLTNFIVRILKGKPNKEPQWRP